MMQILNKILLFGMAFSRAPYLRLPSLFFLLSFLLFGPRNGISQTKSKTETPSPPIHFGKESGSFRIFFGGEEIGEEKFQIIEEASALKAIAEIRIAVDREKEKVVFLIHAALQFTRSFEPLSYQVVQEAGPNKMRARVNFKPGKSEAIYETGKETDTRQIELKKDVMILDDNVFHHYLVLVKRYDFSKGGQQEFSAFVPQQFLSGGVSVADKGKEMVQIGNKNLSLQHLLVDTGELQISLWLNESHELLKLSVPKSNVDVLRE